MLLRLILRNALRHKLRTGLTVLGLTVAILAFGLLRTVVQAWYAGAEATSSARLVTRNSISLVFPMPINYADKIRQVPGVTRVAGANWFGGVYVSEKNFFPQFAVQAQNYFWLYPEYRVPDEEYRDFMHDRKGALAGAKLAERFGWKVGDQIPLRGTIFPGTWTFTLRGIYDGAERNTDTNQFFFHYEYLNESLRKTVARRADQVGVFVVGLQDPQSAAEVSQSIDALFRNSLAETLTETEKAFQLSFVSMTEAILTAIEVVSFVVIVIIMAVMANTMAMTARERLAEYATLKALGFPPGFVVQLIVGESFAIAAAGAALGIGLTFPAAARFGAQLSSLFPVFYISGATLAMQAGAAAAVATVAAVIPAWRAANVRIVEGLRSVG